MLVIAPSARSSTVIAGKRDGATVVVAVVDLELDDRGAALLPAVQERVTHLVALVGGLERRPDRVDAAHDGPEPKRRRASGANRWM